MNDAAALSFPLRTVSTNPIVRSGSLTVKEISDTRPKVGFDRVNYLTSRYCRPYKIKHRMGSQRRPAKYSLKEFDRVLRKHSGEVEWDCFEFVERGLTWVAEPKLPGSIVPRTADRLVSDGLVRKPIYRNVMPKPGSKSGRPPRKFWCKEDLDAAIKQEYSRSLISRNAVPSLNDLLDSAKYPDDEKVDLKSAGLLGFNPQFLRDHSDARCKKRKHQRLPQPDKQLGRLISADTSKSATVDGRRVNVPKFAIGDLRAARVEKPGSRITFLDGIDWHPRSVEAVLLASYPSEDRSKIKKYSVKPFGLGRPCPELHGKSIRCQKQPLPHRKGSMLIMCHGDDLRTIAEALTGVRPDAPKPPLAQKQSTTLAAPPALAPINRDVPPQLRLIDSVTVEISDQKFRITPREADALRPLIAARPRRLTSPELKDAAGFDEAPRYIQKLHHRAEFKLVLHVPGKKGKRQGYGVA